MTLLKIRMMANTWVFIFGDDQHMGDWPPGVTLSCWVWVSGTRPPRTPRRQPRSLSRMQILVVNLTRKRLVARVHPSGSCGS